MQLSYILTQWLLRGVKVRGKSDPDIFVIDGNRTPTVHRMPGYTVWRNHRPKKYHRAVCCVEVGIDWLASQFPVEFATMKLQGIDVLDVNPELNEQITRNAQAWERIQERKLADRCADPETETLYAD